MVSMSKTHLTIRQNITKPCICPNFAKLRGCPKPPCIDLAKSISGNKISNFKIFVTAGSIGIFSEKRKPYRSKPALLNHT